MTLVQRPPLLLPDSPELFQQRRPSGAGEVLKPEGRFGLPPVLSVGYHPSLPSLQSRGPAGGAGQPGWAGLPDSGQRHALEERARPAPAWGLCPAHFDPRLALYVLLTSWSV